MNIPSRVRLIDVGPRDGLQNEKQPVPAATKIELVHRLQAAGLKVTGRSGDGALVEVVEAPNHPWFVACQFHPEFTSGPRDGHPLFSGFVKAALTQHQKKA